ncbi:hypothetical protein LX36DRAFT_654512 [Colletotrichum falcatum]|nr:hypothetical protein LX36DRAFT_654512 [Colletotrichum falcatum]
MHGPPSAPPTAWETPGAWDPTASACPAAPNQMRGAFSSVFASFTVSPVASQAHPIASQDGLAQLFIVASLRTRRRILQARNL